MNSQEYWKEVNETASNIIETAKEYEQAGHNDAEEYINDTLLHETIDEHEWIIYYSYNLPILQESANSDYMVDNIGGLEESLKSGGLSGLHQALAFWAFYGDVSDKITADI